MAGFNHLASVLHNSIYAAEGESITYDLNTATDGGLTSATFDAIQAESRHSVINERGIFTKVKTKDFLIKVSEFDIVGIDKPRTDDRITLTNGDIYEVVAPSTGLDVYDFSDHKQTLYRIHTKKVNA